MRAVLDHSLLTAVYVGLLHPERQRRPQELSLSMFSPVMEQLLASGLLLTTFALVSAVGLLLDQAMDDKPADGPRQYLLMEAC
jgi:hypothetical protein